MQVVNNQLVVLKKMNQEVLGQLPEQPKVKRERLPDIDLRSIWAKFVADTEIPLYAVVPGGRFYLRHYSNQGGVELYKIIAKKGVDYEVLVAATKDYYKTTAFRKTLMNFLKDGVWEDVYKSYIVNPKPTSGAGENPFEK